MEDFAAFDEYPEEPQAPSQPAQPKAQYYIDEEEVRTNKIAVVQPCCSIQRFLRQLCEDKLFDVGSHTVLMPFAQTQAVIL